MIYSPSIVTVGYYFERWRGIATGIAVCGSGIGTFALSPLNNMLIKEMGWKNTFLIQAGIILICVICGLMYRPIKPVKVALNENLDDVEEDKADDEPLKGKKSHEKVKKSDSIRSVKSHKPPTAAEVLHIAERPTSIDTTTTKLSKSSQSLNVNNNVIKYIENIGQNDKRYSVPNVLDHDGPPSHYKQKKERSMSHAWDSRRKHSLSSNLSRGQSVECIIKSRRGTITQIDEKINVSLPRDDAYFAGSLMRLPQYKPEVRKFYVMFVIIRTHSIS